MLLARSLGRNPADTFNNTLSNAEHNKPSEPHITSTTKCFSLTRYRPPLLEPPATKTPSRKDTENLRDFFIQVQTTGASLAKQDPTRQQDKAPCCRSRTGTHPAAPVLVPPRRVRRRRQRSDDSAVPHVGLGGHVGARQQHSPAPDGHAGAEHHAVSDNLHKNQSGGRGGDRSCEAGNKSAVRSRRHIFEQPGEF